MGVGSLSIHGEALRPYAIRPLSNRGLGCLMLEPPVLGPFPQQRPINLTGMGSCTQRNAEVD